MEYLRVHGYPVPAVEELTDNQTNLIMERIHGPSMVDYLSRHPWMIRRQGHVLAALHHQLHEVPPPDYLPVVPVGQGDAFLHMDLHPLNVMMGPTGPVVIDWTNAGRGDPSIDVALAYLLMSSGQIPTNRLEGLVVGVGRRVLTRSFLSRIRPGIDRGADEGERRVEGAGQEHVRAGDPIDAADRRKSRPGRTCHLIASGIGTAGRIEIAVA